MCKYSALYLSKQAKRRRTYHDVPIQLSIVSDIRAHLLPEVARVPHEARVVENLVHGVQRLKSRAARRGIRARGQRLLAAGVAALVLLLRPALGARAGLGPPLALHVEALAVGAPRPLLVAFDLAAPGRVSKTIRRRGVEGVWVAYLQVRQPSLDRIYLRPDEAAAADDDDDGVGAVSGRIGEALGSRAVISGSRMLRRRMFLSLLCELVAVIFHFPISKQENPSGRACESVLRNLVLALRAHFESGKWGRAVLIGSSPDCGGDKTGGLALIGGLIHIGEPERGEVDSRAPINRTARRLCFYGKLT